MTHPAASERTLELDVRTDELLVNMGPQHPSTHGVLRLVLRTDGEVVSEVVPHIGYLHRCAEKIGENVPPIQFIPYTDRMDYLAGMNMNLAYSLAIEKLCGLEVPPRARVLRVIAAELNRIASHLVGMGAYGLDLGTFSPFLYAFREREMILDLFEELCGARLTYSYITIGGVHDDLPPGWLARCREFLTYFRPRIGEYHELLTFNHIFVQRAAGIGILPRDVAISHACTGPVLRASLDRRVGDPIWDLRKVEPYCDYDTYEFEAVAPPFAEAPPETRIGDCWHRFYVRMLEVVESVKIVEQALDRYETAAGSHRIKPPTLLPAGEVYVETECPRGAMGFYVVGRPSGREAVPLRVRAKSSSFCNLSVLSKITRGCLLGDMPAIVGSLDLVMGEIDR